MNNYDFPKYPLEEYGSTVVATLENKQFATFKTTNDTYKIDRTKQPTNVINKPAGFISSSYRIAHTRAKEIVNAFPEIKVELPSDSLASSTISAQTIEHLKYFKTHYGYLQAYLKSKPSTQSPIGSPYTYGQLYQQSKQIFEKFLIKTLKSLIVVGVPCAEIKEKIEEIFGDVLHDEIFMDSCKEEKGRVAYYGKEESDCCLEYEIDKDNYREKGKTWEDYVNGSV